MTADPKKIALGFLDALRRRDFDALRDHLSEDVWFRALLTRGLHESKTREEAVRMLSEWYGNASAFETIETAHHSVEGREFIRYQFRLKPDWAPEQDHIIEQAGFCRVKDGRIRRLDLVCTGFHAVKEARGEASSSSSRAA